MKEARWAEIFSAPYYYYCHITWITKSYTRRDQIIASHIIRYEDLVQLSNTADVCDRGF
jgi:hypothetical protein